MGKHINQESEPSLVGYCPFCKGDYEFCKNTVTKTVNGKVSTASISFSCYGCDTAFLQEVIIDDEDSNDYILSELNTLEELLSTELRLQIP